MKKILMTISFLSAFMAFGEYSAKFINAMRKGADTSVEHPPRELHGGGEGENAVRGGRDGASDVPQLYAQWRNDAGRQPRHAARETEAVRPLQGRVVGDVEPVHGEVRPKKASYFCPKPILPLTFGQK